MSPLRSCRGAISLREAVCRYISFSKHNPHYPSKVFLCNRFWPSSELRSMTFKGRTLGGKKNLCWPVRTLKKHGIRWEKAISILPWLGLILKSSGWLRVLRFENYILADMVNTLMDIIRIPLAFSFDVKSVESRQRKHIKKRKPKPDSSCGHVHAARTEQVCIISKIIF